MRLLAAIVLAVALFASAVSAAIKTETVAYKAGDAELEGFIAYDDSVPATEKRPAVIIVHEWWGLTDYPKMRAQMLAKLGYVAFCADMYGPGKTTQDPKQAGVWAGEVARNPDVEKARAQAAFDVVRKRPEVDPQKIAAIGYCFGGGVALDMARNGMDLAGVVGFHASLATQRPAQKGHVKAQVLVCHGADDTFESAEDVANFQKEMTTAGVTWQMNIYSGAVHAFTNANADKFGIKGVAYNKIADERSWEALQTFLKDVFGK
jgi:dienelactone hydrolase